MRGEKTVTVAALVDSGSDYSIFPQRMALELGIELSEMDTVRLRGAGNNIIRLYASVVPIEIKIARLGFRPITWETRVLFGNNEDIPLLGYKGFFEHFNINLNSKQKEIGIQV